MDRYQISVAMSRINSFSAAKRDEICAQTIKLLTAASQPAQEKQFVPRTPEQMIQFIGSNFGKCNLPMRLAEIGRKPM